MRDVTVRALARWGMGDAACRFVAGRENQVFRVTGTKGDFALRIRRPGLRTTAELRSELAWLDAMDRAGLSVPRPEPSASGAFLEDVDAHQVDMVGWLTGRPLGHSREPLQLDNAENVFFRLGQEMALLHSACDAFEPPHGFSRVHWNIDGLLGEHPLWGRFWENPTLDEDTRILFKAFRARVHHELEAVGGTLDKGLIHADLVRDNVLVDGTTLRLIDFDDGGFGFRLFDVATALLKNRSEPNYTGLKQALLNGYLSARDLDMARLDMFLALRAVTYVGWIVPRMNEEGARARNASFIADARDLCSAYLDTETES